MRFNGPQFMDHLELVTRYLREPGVEIGAFKTPIPGIKPTYLDRFAAFAGEPTLADYYGDACDLPYHDSSLAYVASSHVLEHVANPLAALAEWYRALKHRGIIYLVVPDRAKTFDHGRPLTSAEHILEDYRTGVTQSDGTHIDDFVHGVDWQMYSPATAHANLGDAKSKLASVYHRSVEAGLEINIHFHVFESSVAKEVIALGNRARIWPGRIEILRVEENFPDSNPIGFLLVARVHKTIRQRLTGILAKKGLRPDARGLRK
jgi:SAM-dependent methyltransferase